MLKVAMRSFVQPDLYTILLYRMKMAKLKNKQNKTNNTRRDRSPAK